MGVPGQRARMKPAAPTYAHSYCLHFIMRRYSCIYLCNIRNMGVCWYVAQWWNIHLACMRP
jgi:hypothetical protein